MSPTQLPDNESVVLPVTLGVLLGVLSVAILAFLFIYWRKRNTGTKVVVKFRWTIL
jgi:hypothetical protein